LYSVIAFNSETSLYWRLLVVVYYFLITPIPQQALATYAA
jgi:hypothetical protein